MAKKKQGDGSVFQRRDGRWEGRIVVGYKKNGYAKTKNVTAHTKTECQEKLAKLREECGRRSEKIKPDMPFGDWIDFWYQNYSAPKLRPTTQACYSVRIYTHIIPSVGSIPLNKLTQNDLQQFYARLKKSGKIRKPGTGCVTMINDHLYEGMFSPHVNGKRIAKNIYATTREEREEKLKALIAKMKKEIAEIKANAKNEG